MSWSLLLSRKERDSYEFYLKLFLRNINVFCFSALLGGVMLTLTFINELTVQQHMFFIVSMCAYVLFTYKFIYYSKSGAFVVLHSFPVWRVFVVLSFWSVWLNAYFYYLAQSAGEIAIIKFVLLLAVLYVVRVALLGQFARINAISTAFSVIWIAVLVWQKSQVIFWNSALQGFWLVVFLMIFLYSYNNQLAVMFKVKSHNSRLVEALKRKNIALEESNLAQSRYLSAASHDLRQPLHALALLTSDALRKNKAPEVASTLGKIDQAIDSLSQSFNAVLNLSRLDAGVVKPEFTAVSVQRIFERIAVEFEEVALQKNIQLKFSPSSVWVQSDEGMLHSILSNFVSNALRYTEKGKVLVCVRRGGNGMVRLLVYDTGTGVPAEKASQIFQEYQRLEYAEQRVKGGVGLGLAISERMARLICAQLFVRSVVGKGSCFGLAVPTVLMPDLQTQAIKEREQLSDRLSGKRVAILEDNEVAIDYLFTLLSDWGLDVSIVLSSDMLREIIAEEEPFDLIISDYHLSIANETGLDILLLALELQASNPPKCVLITGDTSSELLNVALKGGVEILYKPVRPVRLRSFLNALFIKNQL